MPSVNIILKTPVQAVNIRLNAFYDPVGEVFVMEDGTTPFVDETNSDNFKPEE